MIAKTPIIPHFSQFVRTDKPHISNSYLSTLKRALLRERQFYGSEAHLTFGTEHHKRVLEPEELPAALPEEQERESGGMLRVTLASEKFQRILQGAKREVTIQFYYREVLVMIVVDILKDTEFWDYKTTRAKSEAEFLKKARLLDYWRQIALYREGTKLNKGDIVGQDKDSPHNLYWLNAMDYPHYLQEGYEELNYLVDTHKYLRAFYEAKNKSYRGS